MVESVQQINEVFGDNLAPEYISIVSEILKNCLRSSIHDKI